MIGKDFSYRVAGLVFLVNFVVFGLVCLLARQTGSFHLRVLCEGIAEANLVLLTVRVWLSRSELLMRLLSMLICLMMVIFIARYGLGGRFVPWVEVAMWYVPVTSFLCALLRLSGHAIERKPLQHQAQTFSIRTIMLITAIVASLFPAVHWLASSRLSGQLDLLLWLTDPLVLVAPISAIGVGLVWAVLSNKLLHACVLIAAAPVFGVLTCRIYGWDYYQSVVIPAVTVAVVVAIMASVVRLDGWGIVRRDSTAAIDAGATEVANAEELREGGTTNGCV